MFKFNNRTPKKIKYNGLNVAKLIFNGVVVWVEKQKNYLPNEIYDLNNWTKSGTSYKYYIKNLPKDAENITISFKHKLCENVGVYTQNLGYFYLQSSEDNGVNYKNIFQFIMGKTIKGFSYTVPNDGTQYALYWYGDSDLFKNIENICLKKEEV